MSRNNAFLLRDGYAADPPASGIGGGRSRITRRSSLIGPEARIRALIAMGAYDDAAALTFRCYGPWILGLLRARYDEADAGDAYSAFAERLCRGLPRFRGACPVRIWALRIARNAALNVAADPYRRGRCPLELVDELPAPDAEPIESKEARSETFETLRARLPPMEQRLLTLRLDQQLSWEEIARILSSGTEAVDSTVLRKRFERMKRRMTRELRRLATHAASP